MPDHARTQIRDAAIALFTGLTTTGANVAAGRAYPLLREALPALTVFTDQDVLNDDAGVMGPKTMRTLGLVVAGHAQGTDEDAVLDRIDAEVQAALIADKTLGGLVEDIEWRAMEKELSGEAERPTGRIRITFAVEYRVSEYDPTVIIT